MLKELGFFGTEADPQLQLLFIDGQLAAAIATHVDDIKGASSAGVESIDAVTIRVFDLEVSQAVMGLPSSETRAVSTRLVP